MRKAEIYLYDRLAGLLVEDENGYTFQYNEEYNFKQIEANFHYSILQKRTSAFLYVIYTTCTILRF